MKVSVFTIVWSFLTAGTYCTTTVADELEFFETRIRPVLVQHCYECHSSSSANAKGNLLVDYRDGIRHGGESGASVVPGRPDESLLLEALRHDSLEMPPSGQLPASVIADFETWIRNGAFDPRIEAPSAAEVAEELWKQQLSERRRWWSLQPLKQVSPPSVSLEPWSNEPVDRFVLTAINRQGLTPAEPENAAVLLRRLSFVLTGLPPSPEQVMAFAVTFKNNPDAALTELVDELLQSPHFGERFARHWMDVVRYTDTYGYEWDNPAKGSWEYRDYLIRAFNDDLGFDQFLREQIAGDLLPKQRIHETAQTNETIVAPMFYHMGEHRHGSSLDFNGIHQDMINNKIDVFSKAFLAMTVACARCHDHKLDAISQADYYALAGVFMSPRWTSRVIDMPGKQAAKIDQLKMLRDKIQQRLASQWRSEAKSLPGSIRKWLEYGPDVSDEVNIEDVPYPLMQLNIATDSTIEEVWGKLSNEWKVEHERRVKSNTDKFSMLTDFSEPGFPENWTTEGEGITHGYVAHGSPLVSLEGTSLIERLLPAGYHTHALSSKLPGAIRLPPLETLSGNHVSLNLRGGEWAGTLLAPQNAFQSEKITFLDSAQANTKWMTRSDNQLKNGVTRVFLEVATSSLNPNFPPRTGLARTGETPLPPGDDGFDKRSWFSITGVATHDAKGVPENTLDVFRRLYLNETGNVSQPPATVDAAWERIGSWFAQALGRWCSNTATLHDVKLLNWMLEKHLLPNQSKEIPNVAALVKQYRDVESRLTFAKTANSMDERDVVPLNYRLNPRGNVDEDGPAIPRRFLEVFADGNNVEHSNHSGRQELADYLSSPDNPQTARVYVNRVWQWIFGRGIVATPSDFGRLGDRPSHPELLDWLAKQFISEGWSTKQLIKRLVLSQTFRQSGIVKQSAADKDPENRLLHHYPTRRLEAEAIRDSLLAVSGQLNTQLYGRPINPPRPVEDGAKRLFSGPLDSQGRRSIYMKMSIMAPPAFLVSFNLPDLRLPTGRRDVTNVPAQALVLLNNPLAVQLAESWGTQVITDESATPEERVRSMFVRALARLPSDAELTRWTKAAIAFSDTDNIMTETDAWTELAHAFFNTKEFIYYR